MRTPVIGVMLPSPATSRQVRWQSRKGYSAVAAPAVVHEPDFQYKDHMPTATTVSDVVDVDPVFSPVDGQGVWRRVFVEGHYLENALVGGRSDRPWISLPPAAEYTSGGGTGRYDTSMLRLLETFKLERKQQTDPQCSTQGPGARATAQRANQPNRGSDPCGLG